MAAPTPCTRPLTIFTGRTASPSTKGALFVADDDAIYHLEDRDADGFYEDRAVFAEVPGFMGRSSEHVTHTLVFDESNDKLYFHAGSEL